MLLRKGVYSYEYMDDWKKLKEMSKEEFYSNQNMEDITNYMHAKKSLYRLWNEYYALYLESDTLLLAHAFKNFRKMFVN